MAAIELSKKQIKLLAKNFSKKQRKQFKLKCQLALQELSDMSTKPKYFQVVRVFVLTETCYVVVESAIGSLKVKHPELQEIMDYLNNPITTEEAETSITTSMGELGWLLTGTQSGNINPMYFVRGLYLQSNQKAKGVLK